jgi:serine/threonine protein kinase
MKDLVVGQVLGRYELLLPIAKGGMAQVWAARLRGTRGFQKIVALKTILAGSMDDERMERMFLEEATLASQIHHPNVVGTLELGEEDGALYLVMEWVDGESLNFVMNRSIGRGGIPMPIAVNLIGQACKGLHAAHDLRDESGALLGVVHRDISAQNVLVTYSGSAKLVDFGIAKVTARSSGLTEAGEIKGKFAYLAPEQAQAQPVDRRTDIFGMGILLYFLTTRRHPFKGANPGETLQKICSNQPAEPPSTFVADYPAELEAVVCKALNKNPRDRWATANDMLSALERAMPQCLDGSFEIQVAEYMSQLLGNRSRERRTELRLAQQMLDGRSGALSLDAMAGSSGSLGAISVDPSRVSSSSESLSSRNVVSQTPSNAVAVVAEGRRSSRKYQVAGGMAVAGGLLLVAALRPWAHGSDLDRGAAAPSPRPTPVLAAPTVEPAGAPAPVAPTTATAIASPVAASNDNQESASGKRARKAPPPAPRASGAVVTPAPTGAAPAQPVERARDAAANAWDPGSFGGRR